MAFAFNIELWRQLYPQFSNISDGMINYFLSQSKMLINTNCFPDDISEILINSAIAHFSQLFIQGSVGRASSAQQGQVSVSLEFNLPNKGGEWWNQTPFGAFVWQYLKSFNGAVYIS